MGSLLTMVRNSSIQNNPIRKVKEFIDKQNQYKSVGDVEKWRFVGYVLDISFEGAQIITNDTYKIAVGGIPRGSFLILVPANFESVQPHFTLLRVREICATPLSQQVQQTYFEMHKKSMPELDIWTQAELQWGALRCDMLGMFYANPENLEELMFSGDVNNIVSPHRYEVYAPNEEILDVIVNGTVRNEHQEEIGYLRTMECMFGIKERVREKVPVKISMQDFMGSRTAMFGKTRLGKSNVVKLLAQAMINATNETNNVGQLIFDINGEYANDSDQDNVSLYSANPQRCEVYALANRKRNNFKELRLNFYENPSTCKPVLNELLDRDGQGAIYTNAFKSVQLSSFEDIPEIRKNDISLSIHEIRKIQIYWSILKEAGFASKKENLNKKEMYVNGVKPFDPGFNADAMKVIEDYANKHGISLPQKFHSLEEMCKLYKIVAELNRSDNKLLSSSSNNKPLFNTDELALLDFLVPKLSKSGGPNLLLNYREFHSPNASDFVNNIIESLDNGQTVILDLGNAEDSLREYISDILSKAVFRHQENKFVENDLKNKYIELYFEEAHNLFPPETKDNRDIYSRFAKEGAKFHIGMVYSTQSPSTISKELLVQTENFFVGHLSSCDEARALIKTQIAFDGVEEDILRARTPGFMRMLTMSNRFVIPVQTNLYNPERGR